MEILVLGDGLDLLSLQLALSYLANTYQPWLQPEFGFISEPSALHSATLHRILPELGSRELVVHSGHGASFPGLLAKCSRASRSSQGNF